MKSNKKSFIILLLVVILGLLTNFLLDKRYVKLMSKNTKQCIAKDDSYSNGRISGPISNFYNEQNNRKILLEELGKYDFLIKGDTVLIKYSLEDPRIAEVIDFCYMKKHKGKAYCKCD